MSHLIYQKWKCWLKNTIISICISLLVLNLPYAVSADSVFTNHQTGINHAPVKPLIDQQLFGFDGHLTDPATGYQFLGQGYHRAYNPVIRRFMSMDSASPFGKGGFNGYIFARNNPVMYGDPSGHMPEWLSWTLTIATGGLVQVGLGVASKIEANQGHNGLSQRLGIASAAVGITTLVATAGLSAATAPGAIASAATTLGKIAVATSTALTLTSAVTGTAGFALGLAGNNKKAVSVLNYISLGTGLAAMGTGLAYSRMSTNPLQEAGASNDIPMTELSACFTANTAITTDKDAQGKKIKSIQLGKHVLTTSSVKSNSQPKHVSYDLIPITPKTWQEVDLSYHDIINGKFYPASIQLLRPIVWLKKHGMHKVGNKVTLSIPEFGINAIHADVTAIKPTTLNTAKVDWPKRDMRPVIGKFKRYAAIVKTYTFKNLSTGTISTLSATPNHPFYVNNKKNFVPIEVVTSNDQLVSATGQRIRLVCPSDKDSHCGRSYRNGRPVAVFNLEIYKSHTYYVGDGVLVHNVCFTEHPSNYLENANPEEAAHFANSYVNSIVTNSGTRNSLVDSGENMFAYPQNLITQNRTIAAQNSSDIIGFYSNAADLAKSTGCGNCGDMAPLAAKALRAFGYRDNLSLVKAGDHALVAVGSGQDMYFVDPWSSSVYKATSYNDNLTSYISEQLGSTNIWKGSIIYHRDLAYELMEQGIYSSHDTEIRFINWP